MTKQPINVKIYSLDKMFATFNTFFVAKLLLLQYFLGGLHLWLLFLVDILLLFLKTVNPPIPSSAYRMEL